MNTGRSVSEGMTPQPIDGATASRRLDADGLALEPMTAPAAAPGRGQPARAGVSPMQPHGRPRAQTRAASRAPAASITQGIGLRWKLAFTVGVAVAVVLFSVGGPRKAPPVAVGPLPVLETSEGGYIDQLESEKLFEAGASLASLAKPGVYTVIGFTTVHCGLSRDIESRMPRFVSARPDVVYRNVRVFSGAKVLQGRSEASAWKSQQAGIRKQYNLDWGPKVYVYGPDRRPIIGETSVREEGYRFLYRWMNAVIGAT